MKYKIFLFAFLAIVFSSCNSGHNHEEGQDHDTEHSHEGEHNQDNDAEHQDDNDGNCNQDQDAEHNHDADQDCQEHAAEVTDEALHEHEDVKIQLIAYSEYFELYAEADPFIIGHESNVLSHFSKLPSFTALEIGRMSIRLIVNGKETVQTLNQPTRKGIYSFNITPETEGKGIIIFDIETENGEQQVIVPDVMVFSEEHDAIHYAGITEITSNNATVFTKEQSWKVEFATELPNKEAFGQVIKTTALVTSTQGDEILVSAKTNGIINLSAPHFLEGKKVAKGQLLFTILGNGLADNNSVVRYTEARNNYEKTKLDYERAQELSKDKIVSEKDLLNSKNQYLNAKALYDNLKGNFSATGENVKSPMDGFVKQLYVKNGEYVEAGQAIVSITQNKTLLLTADVQQKHASILANIYSANIISHSKTYTLEELNGQVLSFGRSTNSDNYMIPVSLQIDNKGDFISGGFVEIYLKTRNSSKAITIPNSSLLEEQGVFYVFVQVHPELFEKREVKLGPTDGLRTEILKGVLASERIVTKGAILIKLAQSTGALDAHSGHVH